MNVMTASPPPSSASKAAQTVAGTEPAATAALVDKLARLFKLLADETRLRILYLLTESSELHVRALCDLLDESQPAVSHHLALLRSAGLIDRRRQGKHNYYTLRARRFTDLVDQLFADAPPEERRSRLEACVRRYWPA